LPRHPCTDAIGIRPIPTPLYAAGNPDSAPM